MKKFIITNIDNYKYTLLDDKGNTFKLNLEFLDIDYSLQINDTLYLSSTIANNPKNFYTFGPLNSKYGKPLSPENAEDILIIDNHKSKIYVKRLYG